MAKTVEIKIPDDIELRVISNAFGLLIASAGLLAGEMLRLQSFDYWQSDIVPLSLALWMAYRLFRNFLSTMNFYEGVSAHVQHPASGAIPIQGEHLAARQISSKPSYSADQVVAEVAKRIESQKADAIKKNKFTS